MALDPPERRRTLLAGAREHGLLDPGEEVEIAVLADLIAPASITGEVTTAVAGTPMSVENETATEGLHPEGPPLGEALVARAHTEGTYVVAATRGSLYLLPAHPHHHDRVDARSGASTREPLGASFVAWQPFAAPEHGRPGLLEVGERRFLVQPGEGEAAAAMAKAVQQARAGR